MRFVRVAIAASVRPAWLCAATGADAAVQFAATIGGRAEVVGLGVDWGGGAVTVDAVVVEVGATVNDVGPLELGIDCARVDAVAAGSLTSSAPQAEISIGNALRIERTRLLE